MYKIEYASTACHQVVIDVVNANRSVNPTFKVVDIGGAYVGWSKDIVDIVVDINVEDSSRSLKVDINDENSWKKVLDYVDKNGKFDYAICTHTLEDIYNPFTVLKILPKIAKFGVITMPSANSELSRVENPGWLGYIHHRWIFDQSQGKMLIIPKLSCLESFVGTKFNYDPARHEIRYWWYNDIPYTLFMDGFLGPDVATVVECYQGLLSIINK